MDMTTKPPLESTASDRIVLDERQKLDHYRAGYKAFRTMLIVCFGGMTVAHFALPESDIDVVLAAVMIVGGIVNELALGKTGWDEHVREQIGSNPAVKRRVVRRELIYVAGIFLFAFCESYFLESESITESLVQGLIMSVGLGLVSWWVDIRQKPKEHAPTES
jgi:O-antigen/teichoic acid export membrane protein